MTKYYHGTSIKNYKEILKNGLKKGSWLTSEYRDAKSYADKKAKQGKSKIVYFEIPDELCKRFLKDDCAFEPEANWIIWNYITKKVLPKEFIIC